MLIFDLFCWWMLLPLYIRVLYVEDICRFVVCSIFHSFCWSWEDWLLNIFLVLQRKMYIEAVYCTNYPILFHPMCGHLPAIKIFQFPCPFFNSRSCILINSAGSICLFHKDIILCCAHFPFSVSRLPVEQLYQWAGCHLSTLFNKKTHWYRRQ